MSERKIDKLKPHSKWGLLEVIELKGARAVICKCKCGKTITVNPYKVLSGHTKSCGNHQLELCNLTGMSRDRIYSIHQDMKNRCYNPNIKNYKNYGARGITVCNKWKGKNGFINFYNWAMENGYRDDLTIDRIDVNGNYEPDNCRWTNMTIQGNNRRNNHVVEYNGEKHTVAEWSKILGLSYNCLHYRLQHTTVERAFVMKYKERI